MCHRRWLVSSAVAAAVVTVGRAFRGHTPPARSTTRRATADRRRPRAVAPLRQSAADGDGDGMLSREIPAVLGGNWMKRSSMDFMPADMPSSDDESVYMDVGIGGATFGTGDLSRRMHGAMMKVASAKFPAGVPDDLVEVYLLYAMDATAKEAVKVAMDSNGYALNLGDDEAMQDEGAWGQITGVSLLDGAGNAIAGEDGAERYETFVDAIAKGGWEPGDPYSFVVREVPSRKKGMDLEALLASLDPDGTLRKQAKEQGLLLPGEDITSLEMLRKDCEQRVNAAPTEASDESSVFRGEDEKGYNVINRGALLKAARNPDGTENNRALLHVMDALANHGCLIVDLTDGDADTSDAEAMGRMWRTTEAFFARVDEDDGEGAPSVPPMQVAEGVGSSHAMVGYASFKDGDNRFLETRIRRGDGALLPEETAGVVGDDGVQSLVDAFRIMSDVGRDVVRIVTAASSAEAGSFVVPGSVVSAGEEGAPSIAGLSFEDAEVSGLVDENDGPSEEDRRRGDILASEAAVLMTDEIMDDGAPLGDSEIDHDEGPVSMSPHRLCRYSNDAKGKRGFSKKNGKGGGGRPAEIFGAHTDTSFVTIVPASSTSGLEVLDEDRLQWYRPELNARRHARSLDPAGARSDDYGWNCRYLVVMPGELLQLSSRNNVPAAVHRVVAEAERPRLSAPVLLRARPGTRMDAARYLGDVGEDELLGEADGMTMEDVHSALQPPKKS